MITLKEFKENLDQLIKQYPEILNMRVIVSSDEEGNNYNDIFYTPTIGKYTEDGQFEADTDELMRGTIKDCNAVCIN